MAAADGFDTVTAISALESTLSLFSDTLQLAPMAFQFVPGMAGAVGVLSGVSSAFDNASKVLDGIDKVRDMCDKVIEIYDQHPDPAAHPQVADALITKAFTLLVLQPQPEIFVRRGGVTRVRPPRRSSRCEGTLRSGGGRAAQVKPCGVAGGIR